MTMKRSDLDGPDNIGEDERNDTTVVLKRKLDHLESTTRDKIQGLLKLSSIVTHALYDVRPVEVLVQH